MARRARSLVLEYSHCAPNCSSLPSFLPHSSLIGAHPIHRRGELFQLCQPAAYRNDKD